jgi:hypothetical protein
VRAAAEMGINAGGSVVRLWWRGLSLVAHLVVVVVVHLVPIIGQVVLAG